MRINTGLEAIDFQVKSPLATELVAIFQDVINFKAKLTNYDLVKKAKLVEEYCIAVALPKVCVTIKKNTGIPVAKIFVSRRFSAMFACCVDFGKDKGLNMYTTIQRYSGIELNELEKEYISSLKVKRLTAKDLDKMAASFDRKTGKMSIDKIAGLDISFILYFDYNAAFLVKETAHVKCEEMTAEEITAIVLHEIGHMMTMFEHAGDAYFKAAVNADIRVKHFFKDKKNRDEVLEYGFNFLEKYFPSKKDAVLALKNKCKEKKAAVGAQGKQVYSMGTFTSMVYIAFVSMFTLLGCLYFLPFDILFKIINPMLETLENHTKLSDYANLRKQYKYCEQLADEFASRHGMSAPLASGLHKLFQWSEVIGLGTVSHWSSLVWTAAKIPFVIYTIFCGDTSSGGGLYDRGYDRVVRAMNNALAIFKSENLPKEALDFYIKDYEETLAIVKQYNDKRKLQEAFHAVQNLSEYLLETPIHLLFTGRFLDEYNKLHNNTEFLLHNTMFYHAAKLKELLERVKK